MAAYETMKRGTNVEQFGVQLFTARKAKGYTQEQLAEKLNISRTNISRWESGKMMPDLDTIKRLSQLLDYNFFAEQNESTETLPPEVTVSATSEPVQEDTLHAASLKKTGGKKPLLIAASVLVLAVIIVMLLLNSHLLGGKPKANVVITPMENPTYVIHGTENDFRDGFGWHYQFQYEETTGVPFTIKEYIVTTVGDGGQEYNDYYTGDDVAQWFGTPTLQKGAPKMLTGGFPLDGVCGVRVTLNGVDDNGNNLSFSGYVTLSKEIKK